MWTTLQILDSCHAQGPDRVYPGHGALPLATYFEVLREFPYTGPVSVELFNQDYYQQPIDTIARSAVR